MVAARRRIKFMVDAFMHSIVAAAIAILVPFISSEILQPTLPPLDDAKGRGKQGGKHRLKTACSRLDSQHADSSSRTRETPFKEEKT
uniref:Uncharacterized protein n=1 Tax=Bursaphelenchus xylophilus TaxID=6326 RepID=A0A1I7SUY1_BURXY